MPTRQSSPRHPRRRRPGKFVIPGLADMHVHFGTVGLLPFDSHTVDRVLRQFLYYGVTTIFNVGATGGGLDDVLDLRAGRAAGRLVGPRIYATGGLLTVPGSHPIATIMDRPKGADAATYDWSKRGVWVSGPRTRSAGSSSVWRKPAWTGSRS